jgi:hypothetical protein
LGVDGEILDIDPAYAVYYGREQVVNGPRVTDDRSVFCPARHHHGRGAKRDMPQASAFFFFLFFFLSTEHLMAQILQPFTSNRDTSIHTTYAQVKIYLERVCCPLSIADFKIKIEPTS